jgi:transcriptional regulator with XRE-family HTH domain
MNRLTVHSRDLLRAQFGENVLRLRRELELSQEELGFLTSLHRTEVGMVERGARLPRLDTILKFAAGLGVTPNELLVGMAWKSGRFEPGHFDVSSREQAPVSR